MRFVCRWREDSPFSKRVVPVADPTVLGWFRRVWDHEDPGATIDSELGGSVYGLETVFEKAQKLRLPAPETVDELRALLIEHLYVEADDRADYIRLGRNGLRVRTDDDEVDLAYYMVDDDAAPDRVAFLLNDTWPLPADAAEDRAGFDPGVPVRTVRLVAPGPEAVFSVRLSWDSPDTYRNLDLPGALMFPGLVLPDLAAHLTGGDDDLPHDVRLLCDLVHPGDADAGPAMERYARLAGYDPSPGWAKPAPDESLVARDPHLHQVARYIDGFFGFDQWFLFDTRWAAAHRDLARSLLRYAAHWDPFED